jgi:hypothetical protein
MKQTPSAQPVIATKKIIYSAMALGLTTSIAFRLLIIFNHIEPTWVRPVWYFGVLGNFVFFYYRFKVTKKRKRAVREHHLIEKIKAGTDLNERERGSLVYLLESVDRSPESLNYLIISIFSVLAIMLDLAMSYY